jgi:putative nucleotidyltransferase with HDIG domain
MTTAHPTTAHHATRAEDLLRRFAAAVRSGQLYSNRHPIIARNLESLTDSVRHLHRLGDSIVLGIVGDELIVNDTPIGRSEHAGGLVRRLQQISVERVAIDRGVTPEELARLVEIVTRLEPAGRDDDAFRGLPHIRVGRITLERQVEGSADIATFRQLYQDAVASAEALWDSAQTDAQPDATVARTLVDGLAQAVSQNRTALLALTTLKNYDNYTFTHMVNVAILTLGQARALGIDGPLLREFGVAALMHDIGKVRTPLEILNKPDKLTDEEFAIMQRHTLEGAAMLRATSDIPRLAPIVAFEHHLRMDGSGYPGGVRRQRLNLGTMLCAIADVYDAMRSQRRYQEAFPTDRILEVLKRRDGQQFDQHLVRRFAQLIGIYPAGNLVRLDTGEIAVVVKVYAPDPERPSVKVIVDRDGQRLDHPLEIDLWEPHDDPGLPGGIVAPVDPATLGIDPLELL